MFGMEGEAREGDEGAEGGHGEMYLEMGDEMIHVSVHWGLESLGLVDFCPKHCKRRCLTALTGTSAVNLTRR